ncbi:MAG: translocation/assembly module TamB, partial [Negativicutes bacterium]|nr:translocation/assembly module TamB [Negativicutes bacterium]
MRKDPSSHQVAVVVKVERADLGLLATMYNDIKAARGEIDGQLTIGGNVLNFTLDGRLRLTDGQIEFRDSAVPLTAINADLVFADKKIEVKNLRAVRGKGSLTVSGSCGLDSLSVKDFDLTTRLDNFVVGRGSLQLPLNGELKLTGGDNRRPLLSGRFVFSDCSVELPVLTLFSDEYYLLPAIDLDVDVEVGDRVCVTKSLLVDIQTRGLVHRGGNPQNPRNSGVLR